MQKPDDDNEIFTIAGNFVNNSNHSVFLTGKAGTGKTTFLKYIKENTSKNTVVVAPTGVAAINAGGTTIHSFFQLPFGPYLPENRKLFDARNSGADKNSLLGNLRLTGERKELMESLDLLIIDEVSMVRCDVLDAIDTILRHVRKQPSKPFGGVQVLYIGDMYQLPPVVKDEEWKILSSCYDNQFFFNSKVVKDQQPVYIELRKVYRQSDSIFINLLNQVRNNEMDEDGYELLHSRYQPDFKSDAAENFITLTTHNNKADIINNEALANLSEKSHSFAASINGSFFENSFPAEELLTLKVGAQVMFLKNDAEKVRRYYNGKIGIVHQIDHDKIIVACDNGSEMIEVKKETWRNIKYSLNQKTQQIEEEELGSFSQYPLRLAWAITIHKSQGLTFQNAVIDAGSAFAPGQVYVALSRCTSLAGIILKSKISYNSLRGDDRIVEFAGRQQSGKHQEQLLFNATKQYQQDIIFELFNYKKAELQIRELLLWEKSNHVVGATVESWLLSIKKQIDLFVKHSEKFSDILNDFFMADSLPENTPAFQERFRKAAVWFIDELLTTRSELLRSPASTDNRQIAKEYGTRIQKIYDLLGYRVHLLNGLRNGFSLPVYREQKRLYKQEFFPVNAFSGNTAYVPKDISHPQLFQSLKEKRNEIATEKNIALYLVCKTESLEEMVRYLPGSLTELSKITGFGMIKIKQFGKEFISVINDYCEINELQNRQVDIPDKKTKKTKPTQNGIKKIDTKTTSFELFKSGKTIVEIATIRTLTPATIESHLTAFLESGELLLDELLDQEKKNRIASMITEIAGSASLTNLVERLPGISYNDIRWYKIAMKEAGSTL